MLKVCDTHVGKLRGVQIDQVTACDMVFHETLLKGNTNIFSLYMYVKWKQN